MSQARIYIAGPMTGLPGLNFCAFNDAAAQLRAAGFEAVNPVEINPTQISDAAQQPAEAGDHLWRQCMKRDIAQLVTCDKVAVLTGWSHSRGAMLEVSLADELGIEVVLIEDLVGAL